MHKEAFDAVLRRDYARLIQIMSAFDSFEDWPWPLVYREIDRAFPGSRFILTMRSSPDVWYDSLCRLAEMVGPTEYRKIVYGHAMPQGHKSDYIAVYERHNEEVQEYFSSRPGQLLVVSWDKGDGWDELCGFLGLQRPGVPFPHVNRSDRLAEILRERNKADR